MADNTNVAEKQFSIQKLYVKDVSFETPNSPEIFTLKGEAGVELNLSSRYDTLEETVYEVALTVTATVKIGDKTAYLAEITQAGIFIISGFEQQEMGPMLGSFCPNVLFPYAREAVSDLVVRGGFPQLLLAPVNFDAVYMQHLQQTQQHAEATLN